MTSQEQVEAILKRTAELEKKKGQNLRAAAGAGAPRGPDHHFNKLLSNDEAALLENYFDHQIAPSSPPHDHQLAAALPLPAQQAAHAVALLDRGGKTRLGVVPCSNNVFRRLIEIPTRPGNFMLSED